MDSLESSVTGRVVVARLIKALVSFSRHVGLLLPSNSRVLRLLKLPIRFERSSRRVSARIYRGHF
jgi:hypothetical protein